MMITIDKDRNKTMLLDQLLDVNKFFIMRENTTMALEGSNMKNLWIEFKQPWRNNFMELR